MEYLIYVLASVNLLAFIITGLDKRFAIKGRSRISERTLMLFAVFGGSIGVLSAMYLFHHKTLKKRFSVGVPLILLLQIAAVLLFAYGRNL